MLSDSDSHDVLAVPAKLDTPSPVNSHAVNSGAALQGLKMERGTTHQIFEAFGGRQLVEGFGGLFRVNVRKFGDAFAKIEMLAWLVPKRLDHMRTYPALRVPSMVTYVPTRPGGLNVATKDC